MRVRKERKSIEGGNINDVSINSASGLMSKSKVATGKTQKTRAAVEVYK